MVCLSPLVFLRSMCIVVYQCSSVSSFCVASVPKWCLLILMGFVKRPVIFHLKWKALICVGQIKKEDLLQLARDATTGLKLSLEVERYSHSWLVIMCLFCPIWKGRKLATTPGYGQAGTGCFSLNMVWVSLGFSLASGGFHDVAWYSLELLVQIWVLGLHTTPWRLSLIPPERRERIRKDWHGKPSMLMEDMWSVQHLLVMLQFRQLSMPGVGQWGVRTTCATFKTFHW